MADLLPQCKPDPTAPMEITHGTRLHSVGDVQFVSYFGSVLLRWARADVVAERFAMATLCETKIARPNEVVAAFDSDRSTLLRARRLLREGGVSALVPAKRGPKQPWRLKPATMSAIRTLHAARTSQRDIADRVGVSRGAVVDALRRMGFPGATPQKQLPLIDEAEATSGSPVEPITSATTDHLDNSQEAAVPSPPPVIPIVAEEPQAAPTPSLPPDVPPVAPIREAAPENATTPALADDRVPSNAAVIERALAQLNPDGESIPQFDAAQNVRYAGVLLGVAAMASLGLIESARTTYGRLRSGVYGLRATLLVLFSMALLRVKRVEGLKGVAPEALGRVLGLARVPEVKTVRRKLTEIAALGKAHELVRSLFARWRDLSESALGFLYVDGHVRAYHGKRSLPKAHVAQLRLAVPATTDYYVNDADGEPLFFVTATANEGLTKILPSLLREVREVVGDRRPTVVFDRGGWSPKLFQEILDLGFDFMTYRKGKVRKMPRRLFTKQAYRADGRVHEFKIASRSTRLNGCPTKLQQVAVVRDDGKQTQIITSRHDLQPAYIAYRMFNRWRQENYFKYMTEEFALDALVDYQDEPADPERSVPNPKWARATRQLQLARAEAAQLEQEYGAAAAANVEVDRPTMRGFKIANGALGVALRGARDECVRLAAKRAGIPKRVPVREVLVDRPCVKLARERKTFTDATKAVAYRAEGILLGLLRSHFSRSDDEGRAFLQEAFTLHADLDVTEAGLHVRLEPMSAPRFTRALASLCAALNNLSVSFPETSSRMTFSVATHPGSQNCVNLT